MTALDHPDEAEYLVRERAADYTCDIHQRLELRPSPDHSTRG